MGMDKSIYLNRESIRQINNMDRPSSLGAAARFSGESKIYIPSTLELLWRTQLAYTIDCVCSKMSNHGLNHGLLLFTFQPYNLPHTLNCICVSLFEFHI